MTTRTDQELESKARDIVRFMDEWEIVVGNLKPEPADDGYAFKKPDVPLPLSFSELYTSLDVIREVEEVIIEERLQEIYADVLYRMAFGADGFQDDYQEFNHYSLIEIATADPKTRLSALWKTLDEAGLLSGGDS